MNISRGHRLHKQIAAWLHIAAGAFVATLIAGLWVYAALLAPIFEGSFIPELFAMFGRPVAVALLSFAMLEIVAAVALLRRRRWARFALVAVGAAQLAVFPIGTALTLYTLWALLSGDEPDTRRGSAALGTV